MSADLSERLCRAWWPNHWPNVLNPENERRRAEQALVALGLDDLDAAILRAREAANDSDQVVNRTRLNKGQARVALEAALKLPRGSSVA